MYWDALHFNLAQMLFRFSDISFSTAVEANCWKRKLKFADELLSKRMRECKSPRVHEASPPKTSKKLKFADKLLSNRLPECKSPGVQEVVYMWHGEWKSGRSERL